MDLAAGSSGLFPKPLFQVPNQDLCGPVNTNTPLSYYLLSYPEECMRSQVKGMNSSILEWQAEEERKKPGCTFLKRVSVMSMGEYLRFKGYLLMLTLYDVGPRRKLWLDTEVGVLRYPDIGRFGLSSFRFEFLLRHFVIMDSTVADRKANAYFRVDAFVAHFNQHRAKTVIPSLDLEVDESMCAWRGKDGNFYSDGLPHVTKIIRKPKGVGTEFKSIADGKSRVLLGLETVKGCYEEDEDGNVCVIDDEQFSVGAGTGWLLRLTKPWHGTQRRVGGDSGFGSAEGAVALYSVGLYCSLNIKTGFPPAGISR